MARPSKFTPELFDKICEEISTSSRGLKYICEDNELSVSILYQWIKEDTALLDKYTRAREEQAHFLAEEILTIADDGTNDYMTIVKGDAEYNVEDREVTNRSKLRVEARKWLASKLLPKKYGDRSTTELTGGINITQITGMEIK